ncbi:MAG: HNH endonuclease [Actinomycetota bacterium]|nr:HNH endonuclease [Actinomycetota bacterium]
MTAVIAPTTAEAPTSSDGSVETTAATTPPPESTIAPTETTTPFEGEIDTLDLLATIPVELEHRGGYARDLFAVWSDLDGDGCDTRAEVLIGESLTPAQVDPSGCAVVAGDWLSSYDGLTLTSPGDVDIDHVVALKEAWDSGAWQWSVARRISYANDITDPRTLTAVSATSNREKGDRDPSNWLPQDSDVCGFISEWVSVKARWSLSMDDSEFGRIRNLLNGECVGVAIAPWSVAP